MKKRILVALLLFFLVPAVALAASYSASLTVTESASVSYDMLPVGASVNNIYLVDSSIILPTGLDTRVKQGSTKLPHMVASDRVTFALPVVANNQYSLDYVTGESALSSFPIITEYSGYFTIPSDASDAMQLGDNFSIALRGWIQPVSGSSSANTTENFTTYTKVDASGKLTVTATKVTGVDVGRDENVYLYKDRGASHFNVLYEEFEIYANSASTVDSAKGGIAITNTIGSMASFATTDIWAGTYTVAGPTYRLYLARGNLVASDYYVPTADTLYYCRITRAAGNDTITMTIYSNAARTTLLDTLTVSGFGTTQWRYAYGFVNDNAGVGGKDWDGYVQNLKLSSFVDGIATKKNAISVFVNSTGNITASIYGGATVTSTIVSSAVHTVNITADGANLKIYVDNIERGSGTIGAGVPDNSNDWRIMSKATSYLDYYSHSVGGSEIARYEPTSMIVDDTLPNELSPGTFDGVITWGTNPAGIGVVVGGLLPVSSSTASDTPGGTESTFVPTVSIDTHTTGTEGTGFPLYGLFKSLFDSYEALGGPHIPMANFWKLVAVIVGWSLGTVVMMLTRNVVLGLVGYFVGFAVPAFAMESAILDVWVPIVYAIGAVCLAALLWKWVGSNIG